MDCPPDLGAKFCDPQRGVRVGRRKYRLRSYESVFVGKEAVDWIQKCCNVDRNVAVGFGKALMQAGLFRHVTDDHDFKDAFLFYRFTDRATAPVVDKAVGSESLNGSIASDGSVQQKRGTFTFLVHGWNDEVADWRKIRKILAEEFRHEDHRFYLFAYESLDDALTIPDLSVRLDAFVRSCVDLQNAKTNASNNTDKNATELCMNFIVYSTGGLIVRHFLREYYDTAYYKGRVKRVIMLAPANCGSPWAKLGKSGVGKYFVSDKSSLKTLGQSGKELLTCLECPSPFIWDLASADAFAHPTRQYFGPNEVMTFVAQGTMMYDDFATRYITRGDMFGTDGTVTVGGGSLRINKILLDLASDAKERKAAPLLNTTANVVYRYMPQFNHNTIKVSLMQRNVMLGFIKEALNIDTAEAFTEFQRKAEEFNDAILKGGYNPGKLLVYKFVMDDNEEAYSLEGNALSSSSSSPSETSKLPKKERKKLSRKLPKLRFEVFAVEPSRKSRGMRHDLSFGDQIDLTKVQVLRNRGEIFTLLKAFGSFRFHSRAPQQFYNIVDPRTVYREMAMLRDRLYAGNTIGVAITLKGNPSIARVIACSDWEEPFGAIGVLDAATFVAITIPEESKLKDTVASINEVLKKPTLDDSSIDALVNLLSNDDDLDDTMHEVAVPMVLKFIEQGVFTKVIRILLLNRLEILCAHCRKKFLLLMLNTARTAADNDIELVSFLREATAYIFMNTNERHLTAVKNLLDKNNGRYNLHYFVHVFWAEPLHVVASSSGKTDAANSAYALQFFESIDDPRIAEHVHRIDRGAIETSNAERERTIDLRGAVLAHLATQAKSLVRLSIDDRSVDTVNKKEQECESSRCEGAYNTRADKRVKVVFDLAAISKQEIAGKSQLTDSSDVDDEDDQQDDVSNEVSAHPGAARFLEGLTGGAKDSLVALIPSPNPTTVLGEDNTDGDGEARKRDRVFESAHQMLDRLGLPARTALHFAPADGVLLTSRSPLSSPPSQPPSAKQQRLWDAESLSIVGLRNFMELYPEYEFVFLARGCRASGDSPRRRSVGSSALVRAACGFNSSGTAVAPPVVCYVLDEPLLAQDSLVVDGAAKESSGVVAIHTFENYVDAARAAYDDGLLVDAPDAKLALFAVAEAAAEQAQRVASERPQTSNPQQLLRTLDSIQSSIEQLLPHYSGDEQREKPLAAALDDLLRAQAPLLLSRQGVSLLKQLAKRPLAASPAASQADLSRLVSSDHPEVVALARGLLRASGEEARGTPPGHGGADRRAGVLLGSQRGEKARN